MINIMYLILLLPIFLVVYRSIKDYIAHRKIKEQYDKYSDFQSFIINLSSEITDNTAKSEYHEYIYKMIFEDMTDISNIDIVSREKVM